MVPSWLLAVALGLLFSIRFASLGPNVTGSVSYAFTFALYGIMITSGLVVHCIYLVECGGEPVSEVRGRWLCVCVCIYNIVGCLQGFSVFGKIDCSLTSSIAVSFLLNGLVDLRLIKDSSCGFVYVDECVDESSVYCVCLFHITD